LSTDRTQRSGCKNAGGPRNDFLTNGSFVDISVGGTTKPKIIGYVVTNARLREPTPVIVDKAAMVLPDALTIPAGFQLTMAARTRRLIVLCDGGGLA
jgi:hypothetical protein